MFQINSNTEQQLLYINQNKKSVIYGIINKINNKIYVGKSTQVKIRLKYHYNSFKRNERINEHLIRAFNKYGIENFEFIILEIVDINLIDVKEQYWINFYKSFDDDFGYNKTMGGDGGNLTIETKLKLSETSPNKKNVYQFDLNGNLINKWNSLRDIQKNLGYLTGTVSKACIDDYKYNKTAYGFFWSYDEDFNKKLIKDYGHIKLKIVQKNLNGDIVKIWNSISEAANKTKSDKSSIIKCCKHKRKICNNYLWEYLK